MQYTWQLALGGFALMLVPVYFIKHSVSCISFTYIPTGIATYKLTSLTLLPEQQACAYDPAKC